MRIPVLIPNMFLNQVGLVNTDSLGWRDSLEVFICASNTPKFLNLRLTRGPYPQMLAHVCLKSKTQRQFSHIFGLGLRFIVATSPRSLNPKPYCRIFFQSEGPWACASCVCFSLFHSFCVSFLCSSQFPQVSEKRIVAEQHNEKQKQLTSRDFPT